MNHIKTLLLGSSGFLGPQILAKHPDIISVGRTVPPKTNPLEHVPCPSLEQLPQVLDRFDFDKVIMMIGSSNHTVLNKQEPLNVDTSGVAGATGFT